MTELVSKYRIPCFWNDEFKTINYLNESFNDPVNVNQWTKLGFSNRFTGDMCDMRQPQPSWNQQFVEFFEQRGWKDVGTSYYRMMPGTILPTHKDTYFRYIQLFNLQGCETTVHRAVVFLEDWQPGHYAEYLDQPFTQWKVGDTVEWVYDTSHMAANVGSTPRYTLQITGHV